MKNGLFVFFFQKRKFIWTRCHVEVVEWKEGERSFHMKASKENPKINLFELFSLTS